MLKMIIFCADFCWCWLEQFGLDIKAVLYMPGKCVYKQIRKKFSLRAKAPTTLVPSN